eukprot:TRINITY_DN4733_c1_g1_i1.p1 TRINITY_DN4733_c1_g1~~TRINITY_DN4733_c1_g1_i1.p1  ORF type:complete len:250 (-),score=36.55 TRINITY_DN4733_c1_g1_i1:251-946(-)
MAHICFSAIETIIANVRLCSKRRLHAPFRQDMEQISHQTEIDVSSDRNWHSEDRASLGKLDLSASEEDEDEAEEEEEWPRGEDVSTVQLLRIALAREALLGAASSNLEAQQDVLAENTRSIRLCDGLYQTSVDRKLQSDGSWACFESNGERCRPCALFSQAGEAQRGPAVTSNIGSKLHGAGCKDESSRNDSDCAFCHHPDHGLRRLQSRAEHGKKRSRQRRREWQRWRQE